MIFLPELKTQAVRARQAARKPATDGCLHHVMKYERLKSMITCIAYPHLFLRADSGAALACAIAVTTKRKQRLI